MPPRLSARRLGILAPAALVALLAAGLRAEAAGGLASFEDEITLITGKRIEGRIRGPIPVPGGADVRIAVLERGKRVVRTYPRDRVTLIEYRGDKQFKVAAKAYRDGRVEQAWNALRELDVEIPGWRRKDPLRRQIGLSWASILTRNKREDLAAVALRDLAERFEDDKEVRNRLSGVLLIVGKDAYGKRDYASFQRIVTELRELDRDSIQANQLEKTFNKDYEAFVKKARAADEAGKPRAALEAYEEAARMKPNDREISRDVRRLRSKYQRFHYGEPTRILSLDPISGTGAAERRIQQFLFAGPVRHGFDPAGRVSSRYDLELARAIRPSRDGRKLTIRLREALKWSDGEPLGAADVLATLKAMTSDETPGRDAVLARLLDLDKSRTRGAHQLVLELNFTTPRPRMILDIPILQAAQLGDPPSVRRGSPVSLKPVSSGAFRLDKRVGNETVLVANEHFRSPPGGDSGETGPRLAEVRVTSFADPTTARIRLENNQIDLLTELHPADVLRLEANGRFRVKHFSMNRVTFLAFNHRRSLGGPQGLYLRRGIALAIDRGKLLTEHYSAGRGVRSAHRLLTGPFPRGSWAYNEDVEGYSHDLDLARQNFRQGLKKGLTLRFIHPPDPIITAICSVMKKQIQDAGADINLTVRLVKLTPALFRRALDQRAFDIAWCDYTFDRPLLDLEPLLADRETGEGGGNYMGYRSPELARMFDLLRLTDLWTKIRALNQEIHRHIHEQAVLAPLWQLDSYYAYSRRVEEFPRHPTHLFGDPWQLRMK